MREILTLQLGHLSNFVATHFWNAQESYFTYAPGEESLVDHDVHWRPGVAADGSDTFLPRTVIYDLKGGFGSLRKTNALYEAGNGQSDAASSSLWPGKSIIHKQEIVGQSAYQQSLDAGTEPPTLTKSTTRYWSDFSRVFYHPKSLTQLYDFELNSSIRPFDNFSMGSELFDILEKDEDIVDRDFRPFVEECDQMQGIQIFSTLDDAWGGFAGRYLSSLRDEYPKACIWLWGLTTPMDQVSREKRQKRIFNTAQTVADACSLASVVVPLSLPTKLPPPMDIDAKSPWHVSGGFGTAVETALLHSRLAAKQSQRPPSLWDMADGLNTTGNQTLASLRMSVGHPDGDTDEDRHNEADFFGLGRMSGSFRGPKKTRVFGQVSSYRGPYLNEHDELPGGNSDLRVRRRIGDPIVQSYKTLLEYPLLDSFPPIYSENKDRENISVRTTLSTDTSQVRHMSAIQAQAVWSAASDEREALSNSLAEIADAYRDDWSSGSDDDDDDS